MKRAGTRTGIAILLLLGAACASFTEPSGERLRMLMGIDVTPAEVSDTPPQVSYSAEVLLSRAEGYYRARRFAEAAEIYSRFMELHATHPWASYALYREGMSYVHQVRTADRDPTFPQQARQAFENLIANYPDSPAVPDARRQLAWAVDQLAQHELGIARFYLRTHRPQAALGRLEHLLEAYPDTPSAHAALFDLGRAREATGDPAGAVSAYEAYLEAPESEKLRLKARKALQRLAGG